MASLTPATILGLQGDFGSLEAGKRADVLVFNAQIEIRRVFVGGEDVLLS
jgi:N-acetylglucosamine-6-phosphate deacetylase